MTLNENLRIKIKLNSINDSAKSNNIDERKFGDDKKTLCCKLTRRNLGIHQSSNKKTLAHMLQSEVI